MNKITVLIVIFCLLSCNQNKIKDAKQTLHAKLVCEQDFYDFGTVKAGEKLEHTFIIKNEGNSNLLISKVIPSCGCTIADYEKKPIEPGRTADIKIIFNTKGRKGMAYKDITVKSNAINDTKTLSFKANIIEENNN